jgi:hypothetical protein
MRRDEAIAQDWNQKFVYAQKILAEQLSARKTRAAHYDGSDVSSVPGSGSYSFGRRPRHQRKNL